MWTQRRIAGAISAKGRTVGVMGTGVDEIYPRENKRLAEQIKTVEQSRARTAVARELIGFMWSIGQHVQLPIESVMVPKV